MQIDKGGIRFIMNGADVMCPGLTSKGGFMADVEAGDIVVRQLSQRLKAAAGRAFSGSSGCSDRNYFCGVLQGVFAEGKEHAMAVGIAKMSSADIRSKNKGIGIETVHFLNDDFWKSHNQF